MTTLSWMCFVFTLCTFGIVYGSANTQYACISSNGEDEDFEYEGDEFDGEGGASGEPLSGSLICSNYTSTARSVILVIQVAYGYAMPQSRYDMMSRRPMSWQHRMREYMQRRYDPSQNACSRGNNRDMCGEETDYSSVIASQCNGRTTCAVGVTPRVLQRCGRMYNYAKVEYECVPTWTMFSVCEESNTVVHDWSIYIATPDRYTQSEPPPPEINTCECIFRPRNVSEILLRSINLQLWGEEGACSSEYLLLENKLAPNQTDVNKKVELCGRTTYGNKWFDGAIRLTYATDAMMGSGGTFLVKFEIHPDTVDPAILIECGPVVQSGPPVPGSIARSWNRPGESALDSRTPRLDGPPSASWRARDRMRARNRFNDYPPSRYYPYDDSYDGYSQYRQYYDPYYDRYRGRDFASPYSRYFPDPYYSNDRYPPMRYPDPRGRWDQPTDRIPIPAVGNDTMATVTTLSPLAVGSGAAIGQDRPIEKLDANATTGKAGEMAGIIMACLGFLLTLVCGAIALTIYRRRRQQHHRKSAVDSESDSTVDLHVTDLDSTYGQGWDIGDRDSEYATIGEVESERHNWACSYSTHDLECSAPAHQIVETRNVAVGSDEAESTVGNEASDNISIISSGRILHQAEVHATNDDSRFNDNADDGEQQADEATCPGQQPQLSEDQTTVRIARSRRRTKEADYDNNLSVVRSRSTNSHVIS